MLLLDAARVWLAAGAVYSWPYSIAYHIITPQCIQTNRTWKSTEAVEVWRIYTTAGWQGQETRGSGRIWDNDVTVVSAFGVVVVETRFGAWEGNRSTCRSGLGSCG